MTKKYETEIGGGDRETLKEFPKKAQAFSFAKKESKNKKWHEVTVYSFDADNEIEGHWYFKNGKLTFDMSI